MVFSNANLPELHLLSDDDEDDVDAESERDRPSSGDFSRMCVVVWRAEGRREGKVHMVSECYISITIN